MARTFPTAGLSPIDVYNIAVRPSAYFEHVITDDGTERHNVELVSTVVMASGGGYVGLNVLLTTTGTAASWVSPSYFKFTQASKTVNGYFCAAEFETASTAVSASDHAVIVLNATNTHTGSVPVSPYILLRDYGGTHADALVRIYGDSGQGDTSTFSASALVTSTQAAFEADCDSAIRCMSGSTPIWILCSTTAPTA